MTETDPITGQLFVTTSVDSISGQESNIRPRQDDTQPKRGVDVASPSGDLPSPEDWEPWTGLV